MAVLFAFAVLAPDSLLFLEVEEHAFPAIVQQHQRLVCIGVACIVGRVPVTVYFAELEQRFLLAIDASFFCILLHELFAPPRQIQVLRAHLVEVASTEVQFFEREEFLLCGHGCR